MKRTQSEIRACCKLIVNSLVDVVHSEENASKLWRVSSVNFKSFDYF